MKLVRENINFERKISPYDSLVIGKTALIQNWLDEMGVEYYIINDDYSIDVKGNVFLQSKNLQLFPSLIQFNKIAGDFRCDSNQLTSLKGGPRNVYGSFRCDSNQLINLKWGPKIVLFHYYCNNNKLISLKGSPKRIVFFYCNNNELINLEYSPIKVEGDYYCHSNKLTSLKGAPKEEGHDFYCKNNSKKFTEQEVRKICNIKGNVYE